MSSKKSRSSKHQKKSKKSRKHHESSDEEVEEIVELQDDTEDEEPSEEEKRRVKQKSKKKKKRSKSSDSEESDGERIDPLGSLHTVIKRKPGIIVAEIPDASFFRATMEMSSKIILTGLIRFTKTGIVISQMKNRGEVHLHVHLMKTQLLKYVITDSEDVEGDDLAIVCVKYKDIGAPCKILGKSDSFVFDGKVGADGWITEMANLKQDYIDDLSCEPREMANYSANVVNMIDKYYSGCEAITRVTNQWISKLIGNMKERKFSILKFFTKMGILLIRGYTNDSVATTYQCPNVNFYNNEGENMNADSLDNKVTIGSGEDEIVIVEHSITISFTSMKNILTSMSKLSHPKSVVQIFFGEDKPLIFHSNIGNFGYAITTLDNKENTSYSR